MDSTKKQCDTCVDFETVWKKDHALVKQMFSQYDSLTDKQQKYELAHKLIREICVHSGSEVLTFYPALKQYCSEDLMNKAIEETVESEKVMYEIENMKAGDPKLDREVDKARKLVLDHIEEEETDYFPRLKKAMPKDAYDKLGSDFESKKKIAPPRPHPSAPKTGIAGMIAVGASKPLDEMKDSLWEMTKESKKTSTAQ